MSFSINATITLNNLTDFNISQICECGQLFRYKKITPASEPGNAKDSLIFQIIAADQKIIVTQKFTPAQKIIIQSTNQDKQSLKNYFDLNTNYAKIKAKLIEIAKSSKTKLLSNAIECGSGIRILKQNLTETIISFIISANNNIPRIQKTIELICENFGTKKSGFYAFPSISQLAKITTADFKKFGAGYRAQYLTETIKTLSTTNFLKEIAKKPTQEARKMLLTLKGVGSKVADCILLFGLSRTDVMPVDTWIKKVYKQNFGGSEQNPKQISEAFIKQFGELSGFAQQYMFNYKRNIENKKEGKIK